MVRGVLVPSGFIRSIEICSLSRIILNPKISSDLTTLCFGASTGNLGIPLTPQSLQQTPQELVDQFQKQLLQKIQYENELQISHLRGLLHMCRLDQLQHPLNLKRISNVTIRMFLNDNFVLPHRIILLFLITSYSSLMAAFR